ncbi:MAG: glycosyltransferase [Phycisphaerales bacterium]|nr:glycosyltransferase [Phycisphaerales bacterium]
MLIQSAETPDSPAIVIIPAHNAARTIARAIASVMNQGLAALVVDDGSTDNTASLADAAGAQVLTQLNSGPGAARNRGLAVAAARGAHALFLDADDELARSPDGATSLLALLDGADSPAAAFGGHEQIQANGHAKHNLPRAQWVSAGRLAHRADALGTDAVFCTTGLALSRRAITDGLRFDERLWFGEDRDLIYRAAAIASVAVTGHIIVRKHAEADRLTASPRRTARWLSDVCLLAELHGPAGEAERAALREQLSWVLKNTCRVLARQGQCVDTALWVRASRALTLIGGSVSIATRKWCWLGRLRSARARGRPAPR